MNTVIEWILISMALGAAIYTGFIENRRKRRRKR